MYRKRTFSSSKAGVSPVIGVIIAVAITVILASIAYVYFSSLTGDVGTKTVEPLSVTPELNIERVNDELLLKIVIGRNIDWDDYAVMLNYKIIETRPGTISTEGDTLYFDYEGPPLQEGAWYNFQIIDINANMVVYDEEILALSYPIEGTGVYGYVRSTADDEPVPGAVVKLFVGNILVNMNYTDPSGAYWIEYTQGTYTLVVEINESNPETFGLEFNTFSVEINILQYYMFHYDVGLEPKEEESAVIKGTVYDKDSGAPLSGVEVKITDNVLFNKLNTTTASGYFELTLPPRNISFFCSKAKYKSYVEYLDVEMNDTITLDVYLEPIPVQTSTIFGYVYDSKSGAPLSRVNVFTSTEYMNNYSKTEDNGYYEIHIVPGNVSMFVNTADYELWEYSTSLVDREEKQVDIYLTKEAG